MRKHFGVFLACLMVLVAVAVPLCISAEESSPYQGLMDKLNSYRNIFQEGRPVAFQDLNGDSVPDMIYVIRQSGSESYFFSHILYTTIFSKSETQLDTADFGPQAKGVSILEIYAGKDYLVIGCGCGSADNNEFPAKREYVWYRHLYGHEALHRAEKLAYFIDPNSNSKKWNHFYYRTNRYGTDYAEEDEITAEQYREYLDQYIKFYHYYQ